MHDVDALLRVLVLHSDLSAAAAVEADPGVEGAAPASRADSEAEVAMRGQHLQGNESKNRAA